MSAEDAAGALALGSIVASALGAWQVGLFLALGVVAILLMSLPGWRARRGARRRNPRRRR